MVCFICSELGKIIESSELLISRSEVECQIHDILKRETGNSSSRLEKLRFQPRNKSKLNIPLCRMVSLPIVRPYLKNDVMSLAEFGCVLYVSSLSHRLVPLDSFSLMVRL